MKLKKDDFAADGHCYWDTFVVLFRCFVLHHFRSENPKNYRSIFLILKCFTRFQGWVVVRQTSYPMASLWSNPDAFGKDVSHKGLIGSAIQG